jgi:hypothetical protein
LGLTGFVVVVVVVVVVVIVCIIWYKVTFLDNGEAFGFSPMRHKEI